MWIKVEEKLPMENVVVKTKIDHGRKNVNRIRQSKKFAFTLERRKIIYDIPRSA